MKSRKIQIKWELLHRRKDVSGKGSKEFPEEREFNLEPVGLCGIYHRKEFPHEPDRGRDEGLFRKLGTHSRETVSCLESEKQPWHELGSNIYRKAVSGAGLVWFQGGATQSPTSFPKLVDFPHFTRVGGQGLQLCFMHRNSISMAWGCFSLSFPNSLPLS